jgi:glycosyltransferase involved in cell wall biosynthesis
MNNYPTVLAQKNNPLVSIIIPSFNQGKYIEKCIASILNQSYKNIEIIIIDGGSTDETISIIEKYSSFIYYWQSKKDNGQSDAINQGFLLARGKYVGWINSDDELLPDCIQNSIDVLDNREDIILTYGSIIKVDENDNTLSISHYPDFNLVDIIKYAGYISQPGNIIRRSSLKTIGLLDESLHFQMDLDLWIRLSFVGKLENLHIPLAKFRIHNASKTSIKKYIAAHDILYIYSKLYSRQDLPIELLGIKKEAYCNAYLYCANQYLDSQMLADGMKYLSLCRKCNPKVIFSKKYFRSSCKAIIILFLGYSIINQYRLLKLKLSSIRTSTTV